MNKDTKSQGAVSWFNFTEEAQVPQTSRLAGQPLGQLAACVTAGFLSLPTQLFCPVTDLLVSLLTCFKLLLNK